MGVSSGEAARGEKGLEVIGSKGLVYESGSETAIGTIAEAGVAACVCVARRRITRLREGSASASPEVSEGVMGVMGVMVGVGVMAGKGVIVGVGGMVSVVGVGGRVAGRTWGEEGTARSKEGNASLAGEGPPSIIGFGAISHVIAGSHHHFSLFAHEVSHSACHCKKCSSDSSSPSAPSSSSSFSAAACRAAASFSLMNSPRLPRLRALKGVIDDEEAAREGAGDREVEVGTAESLLRRPGRSERRALRRRMRSIRSDSSSYESSS